VKKAQDHHGDTELHRENAFVQKLLLVKVGNFS